MWRGFAGAIWQAMAVIAIYSSKGGVGKTTIAVDLAWRSAIAGGYRTLLWDLDVQGGSGYLLGRDVDTRTRAASVFQREGRPLDLVVPTAYANLSLLNADDSLRALPLHLARLGQRKRLAGLTRTMQQHYHRIVLDCPPMQNELSDQILAAADVVIVPLPASPLSARALDLLRRDLARDSGRHPPILPVLSMYDSRRKAHREVREGAMARYPVVPASSHIEQVAFRRAPVSTFAPWSEGARSLDLLWRTIEARLGARDATAEAAPEPPVA